MTRTTLGEHFSEGARQLWLVVSRQGWSQLQLARSLGKRSTSSVVRILYGDGLPSARTAALIEEKLGIAPRLWTLKPDEPFTPPAAAPPSEVRRAV